MVPAELPISESIKRLLGQFACHVHTRCSTRVFLLRQQTWQQHEPSFYSLHLGLRLWFQSVWWSSAALQFPAFSHVVVFFRACPACFALRPQVFSFPGDPPQPLEFLFSGARNNPNGFMA